MAKGDERLEKEKVSMNLARLKIGGELFAIVVDPDKAIDYKHGKDIDIREVLRSEKIFKDAHKGEMASEHLMEKLFKTTDVLKVADTIIKKGEIQLTTEYREKLVEEKKRSIIEIIHRNAIDPVTNRPHPATRIESAMSEAKVKIDEHKRAEDQVQDIVKKMMAVMPIKLEIKQLEIRIQANHASKAYSLLKSFGTVVKDEWQNDGSLVSRIKIPAGLQQDFYDEINKLTKGEVEIREVN